MQQRKRRAINCSATASLPVLWVAAVLLLLLPGVMAVYGTNRCLGSGTWTHWSPGASQATPCLVLTNGIKNTNVAYSKPLCSLSPDYAYKTGLDGSPIATIVPIFDWVLSAPTLFSDDPILSIGFTNGAVPSVIGDDTSSINWIVLDQNHPTEVLDISTSPPWGSTIIVKFECGGASCRQATLHDIYCYQETLVDRSPYGSGQDPIARIAQGPFSINCDSTYGYGNTGQQMCTNNWAHAAHTYWMVSSVSSAATDVVSYHIIPGFSYGDASGLTTNTSPNSLNSVQLVSWPDLTYNNYMAVWYITYTNDSFGGTESQKIIDLQLFGNKNTVATHGAYLIPTNTLAAGVFLLQDKSTRLCSSSSTCNNVICFRQFDYVASVSQSAPIATPYSFAFTYDWPLSCASDISITIDLSQDSYSLVTQVGQSPTTTQRVITFTIDDGNSLGYAPTTSFDFIVSVQHSSGAILSQSTTTVSYTNVCSTTSFTFDTSVPVVSVSHTLGDTSPLVVNVAALTPDSASAGYTLCAPVRTYTGPVSVPPGMSTFSVNSATGELTTALDAAQVNTLIFIETIQIDIVVAGSIQVQEFAIVEISAINECESTLFTFDPASYLATLTHTAGVVTPIATTTIAAITPDSVSESYGSPDSTCAYARLYSVTYFDNTILETPSIASNGDLTTQLLAGVATSSSTDLEINIDISIGGIVFTSAIAKITITVEACEMTSQTVFWDASKEIQIRSNLWEQVKPEWAYNVHCTGGIADITFEFIDGTGVTVSSMPGATLDIALGKFSILTLKEHSGTTPYTIRWTQTNHNAASPSLKITQSAEIVITYVDDCDLSSIQPFNVQAMETSVLRTVSESSSPPDVHQEVATDAYPLLLYGDVAWNNFICGDMALVVTHDGLSSDFVTYGYTYQGVAASRYIDVLPTLNSQVNTSGYNLILTLSLVEYPSVTVDVPITIVVLPCEIKSIDTVVGSEYVSPYIYTILSPTASINIVNYVFTPACDYTPEYSLQVAPTPAFTMAWIPDNLVPTISVYTPVLSVAGTYTLTITVLLNDYASSFGTSTYTRVFNVLVFDPCANDTLLIPSITTVDLYAIIGIGNLVKEIPDYPDTVSAAYDSGSSAVGYTLCGLREHSIAENTYDESTGAITSSIPQSSLTYIDLVAGTNKLLVTYGTEDINKAGTRLVGLTVNLQSYPTIVDNSGILRITFLQQMTDLTLEDAEYTIAADQLVIDIPELSFNPPLHSAIDEETGLNGNELALSAHLVGSDGTFTSLPVDIGTLDAGNRQLIIYSTNPSKEGSHTISIHFTGQAYLSEQVLTTQFNLEILPQPIEAVFGGALSLFELDGVDTDFELEIGQAWTFTIPPYEDTLEGVSLSLAVDLGSASTFVTFDEALTQLSIEEGASTSTHVGQSSLKVNLKSPEGDIVSSFTVRVTINGDGDEASESASDGGEDGSTSESEGAESETVTESTSTDEETENEAGSIGALFASLLKKRKREQNFEQDEIKKKPKPPTARLVSVSQLGLATIEFSKTMNVIPQLQTLNQDGIIADQSQLRRALASSETKSIDEDSSEQAPTETSQAVKRQKLDIIGMKMIANGFSEEADLGFKWEVKSFTSKKLEIQIKFEKPIMISNTNEQDEIEISFKSEDFFFDEQGFSLSDKTKLRKKVPPQFGDADTMATLDNASAALGSGTQGIFAVNVLINILMSASLQYLWDLINAQQIVILLPLFNVQTPSNAKVIFNALMSLAAFEAIPTELIYATFFYKGEGFPINSNFETIGFEHHLLLNNFGSLGFVCVLYSMLYILYIFTSNCCTNYKRGRKLNKKLHKMLFWNGTLRIVIESYTIGLICCLLNARMLDFSRESKWVYANSVLTVIILPSLLLFPLVCGQFLYRKFDNLKNQQMKIRYGEIYEGYNIKSKWFVFYWMMEYVRKVILALLVVIFQSRFFVQMTCLFISSLTLMALTRLIRTRQTRFSTRMDTFNEIKLLIIMYHMMLFTMAVPDPEMRYNIGYSVSFFLVLGTAINMFQLIASPIIMAKRFLIIYYAKRRIKRDVKRNRPNVKLFAEKRDKYMTELALSEKKDQVRINQELAEKEILRVETHKLGEASKRQIMMMQIHQDPYSASQITSQNKNSESSSVIVTSSSVYQSSRNSSNRQVAPIMPGMNPGQDLIAAQVLTKKLNQNRPIIASRKLPEVNSGLKVSNQVLMKQQKLLEQKKLDATFINEIERLCDEASLTLNTEQNAKASKPMAISGMGLSQMAAAGLEEQPSKLTWKELDQLMNQQNLSLAQIENLNKNFELDMNESPIETKRKQRQTRNLQSEQVLVEIDLDDCDDDEDAVNQRILTEESKNQKEVLRQELEHERAHCQLVQGAYGLKSTLGFDQGRKIELKRDRLISDLGLVDEDNLLVTGQSDDLSSGVLYAANFGNSTHDNKTSQLHRGTGHRRSKESVQKSQGKFD